MYVKIGALALALSIPLAFVFPLELTFENGVVENLQVAVLLFCAVLNGRWIFSASNSQQKWFHIFCAALMILFVLRELSWGRVFFPVGTSPTGSPQFVPMAEYPYRVPVHIFLAAYILALAGVLIKFLPVKRFLLGRKPWGALAVIGVGILLAHLGEHGYIFSKEVGEVLEELDELVVYAMTPAISAYYREFLA